MRKTGVATNAVRKIRFTLRTVVLSRHYIAANPPPIVTVMRFKWRRLETSAACELRPGEPQKRSANVLRLVAYSRPGFL